MDVSDLQSLTLRSEAEVMSGWVKGPDEPLVSIICCAFNHEPYIETALKGFLIQETSFPFEILVSDDASTDGTADVIRAYHQLYPNIIKPILQYENQYSRGNRPSKQNRDRSRGEYLAVCEGDDCWTDSTKLQRQVDELEKHSEVDICFHSATKVDYSKNGLETIIGRYAEDPVTVIPIEQIVLRSWGLIPTASVMVRREVLSAVDKFREGRKYLSVGDIYLLFFGAMRGGALYIDRNMSFYRAKIPGSWTLKNQVDYLSRIHNLDKRLRSYKELDKFTGYKFTWCLATDSRRRFMGLLKESAIPVRKKVSFYRKHRDILGGKDKVTAVMCILFAPLYYKLLILFKIFFKNGSRLARK